MSRSQEVAMSTLFRFSLLFVLMTGSAHAAIQSDSTSSDSQSPRQKLISSYGKLPLSFEANQGQTDSRVGFLSRGEGYHLYLTSTEAVLALTKRPGVDSEGGDTALRMKLAEANPHPKISGEEELPGKSHYFVGRDPSKWRTDIPTYAKVRYREVYPGIDLIYYGNQRQLEYDFVVAPGADPKRIELQFEGADRLLINEQGDLLLKIKGEEIQFLKPRLYQEVNGIRREVLGRYVLRGKNRIGFQVADYDPSRLLIIDPVLSYSTFFGGTSSAIGFRDSPSGIAVDGSGAIYLAGSAGTTDFPVTPGAPQSSNHGKQNVFISKLNPAGTALIYSTYLGGSAYDINTGIAIDSSGNAYVIGYTYSTDFPTTPGALQTVAPSPTQPNNFAAKLNASGTALIYSTYLPDCGAGAIAVDNSGDAYIAGSVFSSPSCPTTAGVYQPFFGGGNSDAFVMKLNPAGSIILYATYLGGSNDDEAAGIVVDATGNAYVTGRTLSINFPLVHPLQSAIGGGWDAFVAKINPTGSDLEYATYWGGSENDYGYAIAIDPSGNAYFTGYTYSSDFPVTPGAFQTTAGKSIGTLSDAFISQIGPHGATLGYSSYLGGSDYDSGSAIAVDSAGNAYVAGLTGSSDFPLARAMKNSLAGSRCGENIPCWNAFVARVNAGGDALTFSTFLGGSGGASSNGIALDSHRNIYLVGSSFRGDFPITSGAFQKDPRTMFITKIAESSVVTTITATPQSGIGPFTVHFEGAATSESGAAITSYFWDFGDGTTGTGPKVDHTYTASRGYTAQLTATDSNSQQGSAHVNINVSDFTLSLSPDSADIVPGESATATLVIQPVPYEGIPVNLSCSVPSVTGLACSMNPTSVVANFPIDQRDPGTTSMLAVTTQASTPIGSYPVTITGRSGGAVHQVTFLLRVRPGDTFNKPDGPTLGSNWNVILPVLEIFSGQVRNQDSGDKAAIFNWPIGPDQDVSVNCKVTAENNGCGVMARWSSPDNYYYARIDVGHLNLVLFKSVNGVVTQLGKTDLPLRFTRYDTYYPIRLVTRGNSLFASVVIMQWADGCSHNNCVGPVTYAITAADNSLSSGDYSGIRSFASAPDTTWFKTFSVIRPDTPMQGELLFTDEFNRTTGLGSNWQVFFGS